MQQRANKCPLYSTRCRLSLGSGDAHASDQIQYVPAPNSSFLPDKSVWIHEAVSPAVSSGLPKEQRFRFVSLR